MSSMSLDRVGQDFIRPAGKGKAMKRGPVWTGTISWNVSSSQLPRTCPVFQSVLYTNNLTALKRYIPSSLHPLARTLYHSLYRAALRFQWRILDWRRPPSTRTEYPLPPARLRFRVAENASVINF